MFVRVVVSLLVLMRLVRTLGVVDTPVPAVVPVSVVEPNVVDPIKKEEQAIFTRIKSNCYAHVMEHKR